MENRTLLAYGIAGCLAVANVSAQVPTFRIAQVFSSLDGSVQYVELTEFAGLNGQHRFAGLTLKLSYDGSERTFTFPSDLHTEQTANLSIVVAAAESGKIAVGNSNFSSLVYRPAFWTLPPRFLRVAGATLDFAGVDRVTYDRLPSDGTSAWYRDGSVKRATVPGFACPPAVLCATRLNVADKVSFAIEYYHAVRDHYFFTALADEIEALDSGRISGWQRTGESFGAGGGPRTLPELHRPVCRFHSPSGIGVSHFFSASAEECDAVQRQFPEYTLETRTAFYATLPGVLTGICPTYLDFLFLDELPLRPLYRLWNQRRDSNHRYTTSAAIRETMVARGYVSEGYGPDGVAMCVL